MYGARLALHRQNKVVMGNGRSRSCVWRWNLYLKLSRQETSSCYLRHILPGHSWEGAPRHALCRLEASHHSWAAWEYCVDFLPWSRWCPWQRESRCACWVSWDPGTLIMDPPTVRAAVQYMLTATRTEVSFTFDLLKEKEVARGDGRHGTLHGPAKRRANQMLMETVSIHTLRWTLQRKG